MNRIFGHNPMARGCSSYGRALALHARGTGFDSLHLQYDPFCGPFLSPISILLRTLSISPFTSRSTASAHAASGLCRQHKKQQNMPSLQQELGSVKSLSDAMRPAPSGPTDSLIRLVDHHQRLTVCMLQPMSMSCPLLQQC